MLRFDIFTLFPGMFAGPLDESILKRAQQAGVLQVVLHDLRAWATDRHRTVDDYPFGGGAGMVMKPEPLFAAVEAVQPLAEPRATVVLLSPQGRRLDRALVGELAVEPRLLLVCGRYEGVDERAMELFDEELSIGDFVLTGGELPALVVADAVVRKVPGVLKKEDAAQSESFATGLLDFPQYTRPRVWRGREAPEILFSGDHARIAEWRQKAALKATPVKAE